MVAMLPHHLPTFEPYLGIEFSSYIISIFILIFLIIPHLPFGGKGKGSALLLYCSTALLQARAIGTQRPSIAEL